MTTEAPKIEPLAEEQIAHTLSHVEQALRSTELSSLAVVVLSWDGEGIVPDVLRRISESELAALLLEVAARLDPEARRLAHTAKEAGA